MIRIMPWVMTDRHRTFPELRADAIVPCHRQSGLHRRRSSERHVDLPLLLVRSIDRLLDHDVAQERTRGVGQRRALKQVRNDVPVALVPTPCHN